MNKLLSEEQLKEFRECWPPKIFGHNIVSHIDAQAEQIKQLTKENERLRLAEASKEYTGWKKHELGWIDEKTGLLWHSEFKTNLNHDEATKWANEQGKRLPTQEEFIEAENNGIRKLENIEWKHLWFWSSSLYPGNSDAAYLFNGGNGYADGYYYRNDSYGYVAARCVSR